MDIVSVEQIKAARALLGWNQKDLATAANMSKPALANLERYTSSPRVDTLMSIRKALEEAGIDFIPGPGVRLRQESLRIQVLEGNDCIFRLWNDIFDTLRDGEERLMCGVDEIKFLKMAGDERYAKIISKYKKKEITGRILCLENDKNFLDPSSEYRWVSKDVFEFMPYYVYANKYALFIWEPTLRIVVIENKAVAENFRKQFEKVWKASVRPDV